VHYLYETIRMDMKKTNNHADEILASPQGAMLQSQSFFKVKMAQMVFFINGLMLTIATFVIFTLFAHQILQDEYEYVREDAVKVFHFSAMELDYVMNFLATKEIPSKSETINNDIPGINKFEKVFVLSFDKKKWVLNTAYENPVRTIHQSNFQVNSKFLKVVLDHIQKNHFQSSAFLVPVDKGFYKEPSNPIVLAVEKKLDGGKRQIVIGVTDIKKIFNAEWQKETDYISKISFKPSSSSKQEWSIFPGEEKLNFGSFEMVYSKKIWQTPIEISIEFHTGVKHFFIKKIPYIFGFLGLAITLSGVFYIRFIQRKSEQLAQVNDALELKNNELVSQIEQKEHLNTMLGQSELDHKALIDSVSDIIFETDTHGEILFVSAAWRKVTGFDSEQSIGQDIFSMLHPQEKRLQRKDFDFFVKGQKQAYRTFTRLLAADGTFRAVELALSMIRQDKDKNLRVVGTLTDVEERRRAERALSEAEKKYRTIVENAAGGIYQLTPEGIYLSANRAMARILAYETPEQMLREVKNANITVYADPKARAEFIIELRQHTDFFNYETQMVCKDGKKIWVNENIRVVKDDLGNVLYFEGSIEDITLRKITETTLREAKLRSDLANRAKSEFLANMSHELRTPLNSIIGFSDIIKNEVFGPIGQNSYLEYAKDINKSGQSLLKVISEILDISRIEAGDRQLNESIVDLEKIMQSALELLSVKISNNNMNVINNLRHVPHIIGEELAIKQIIMNLLSNAVKFSLNGGRISISFEVNSRGELLLSITDTGIGIEESEIEKILSPFGQADNEFNRNVSGSGLGLTLVNALVVMHGGRFELFSQKGIGTTATVVFPVERVTMAKENENVTDSRAVSKKITNESEV